MKEKNSFIYKYSIIKYELLIVNKILQITQVVTYRLSNINGTRTFIIVKKSDRHLLHN